MNLFFIICFMFVGHSEEVNDFLPAPKDSTVQLNQIINLQLQKITTKAGKDKNFKCERSQIKSLFMHHLNKNMTVIGNILRGTHGAGDNQQRRIDRSIDYNGYRREDRQLYPGSVKACCVARLTVAGVPMGLDKVGHFFGNGGMLWLSAERSGSGKHIQGDVLKENVRMEHSLWGLSFSRVKSYGDLAANWDGYRFWSNLIDGDNPYYKCEKGKLKLQRKFDISEYANWAWNESINCSSYSSKDIADYVQSQTEGQRCPVKKERCVELAQKYSDKAVRESILSPKCINPELKFNFVESKTPVPYSDLVKAAEGIQLQHVKEFILGSDK